MGCIGIGAWESPGLQRKRGHDGKRGLYGLYRDCGDEEKPGLWKETRSRQGKGVYEGCVGVGWVCRVFDGRNVKKWDYGGCIHGEMVDIGGSILNDH